VFTERDRSFSPPTRCLAEDALLSPEKDCTYILFPEPPPFPDPPVSSAAGQILKLFVAPFARPVVFFYRRSLLFFEFSLLRFSPLPHVISRYLMNAGRTPLLLCRRAFAISERVFPLRMRSSLLTDSPPPRLPNRIPGSRPRGHKDRSSFWSCLLPSKVVLVHVPPICSRLFPRVRL